MTVGKMSWRQEALGKPRADSGPGRGSRWGHRVSGVNGVRTVEDTPLRLSFVTRVPVAWVSWFTQHPVWMGPTEPGQGKPRNNRSRLAMGLDSSVKRRKKQGTSSGTQAKAQFP